MRLELDSNYQTSVPDVILSYKSGEKQDALHNIDNFVTAFHMNSADEISFDLHKFINGIEEQFWDDVHDFKLVYLPHYDSWYEIYADIDVQDETVKHVSGIHAQEAELAQLQLYDTVFNTEDDIARDDYVAASIYNKDNPEASILTRILKDKATHYSIEYVAPSIASLYRAFQFDGESIADALNDIASECSCYFVFGESSEDDGQLHRTISCYDLLDYCADCGQRGNFTDGKCTKCGSENIIPGYGHDTTIFVSKENLTDAITYETDEDSVKNCFRLTAGDDDMTAAVINSNPNGSRYIWYFPDEIKADMSEELRSTLNAYDRAYNAYRNTTPFTLDDDSIAAYNALAKKYSTEKVKYNEITNPIKGYVKLSETYYDALDLYSYLKTSMTPYAAQDVKTTAVAQASKLTNDTMSPIGVNVQKIEAVSKATADSSTVTYAKTMVDTSRYQVTVSASSFVNPVWTGKLKISSYLDDEDTAETQELTITFNNDYKTYLETQVTKIVAKIDTGDALSLKTLFQKSAAEFAGELTKFSMDNLKILQSACESALNVLTEQGIGDPDNMLYDEMYKPYYEKSRRLVVEIENRQKELDTIAQYTQDTNNLLSVANGATAIVNRIAALRTDMVATLDMRKYLGEQLWTELSSFRRDDEYNNDNYISDGLTSAQVVQKAGEFLNAAQEELIKSATLQHTISGSLFNLLVMPEFSALVDYFELGNWLRFEVDDKIYKLRLTDFTIDYSDITKIETTFSDVVETNGSLSDIQSLIAQTKSMSTSYSATQKQADKGSKARQFIQNMVENGLSLTQTRIVDTADNQNIVVDDHGILLRRLDDYSDTYNDEQVKIINNGIYYSKDNWETVSTGLGHYKYYDPDDGVYKDGYGVIADTVVGRLILGNNLKIYSESGSLKMDGDGLTVTADPESDNSKLFRVRTKNADGSYTNYIYVDKDGKVHIQGTDITLSSGTTLETYIEDTVDKTTADRNSVGARNILRNTRDLSDFFEEARSVSMELKGTDLNFSLQNILHVKPITASVDGTNLSITNPDIQNLYTLYPQVDEADLELSTNYIFENGYWDDGGWIYLNNGDGSVSVIDASDSKIVYSGARFENQTTGQASILQLFIPVINGETYTISGIFRIPAESTTTSVTLFMSLYDNTNSKYINRYETTFDKVGKWTVVSHTFKLQAEQDANISVAYGLVGAGNLDVCAMKLEQGETRTDWSPNPLDLEDVVEERVAQAKEETQEQINKVTHLVADNKDVLDLITKGYDDQSELDSWMVRKDSEVSSLSVQNEGITGRVDTVYTLLTTGEGEEFSNYNNLLNSQHEITNWFTFDENFLTIGRNIDGESDHYFMKLTNKQLAFYLNSTASESNRVAYFNTDEMGITNAIINNNLRIGDFKVFPRTNGNLSIRWIGG